MAAFFQSVTARTAGFNTIDIGAMRPAALLVLMLFMFVGGAVEYRVGEEYLVMLERGPRGLRSAAMNLSKKPLKFPHSQDDAIFSGAVPARKLGLVLPFDRAVPGVQREDVARTGRGADVHRVAYHHRCGLLGLERAQ